MIVNEMEKDQRPLIIWLIILFWILFFLYCSFVAVFSFQSHFLGTIICGPLALLSLVFTYGIYRRNHILFTFSKWINISIIFVLVSLLIFDRYSSNDSFIIFIISLFVLFQAISGSAKVKKWFKTT